MDFLGISGTEWVGYLATAGVLISFLMKDIVRLRTLNMVGCFFWVLYGFMLDIAWPVIITNTAIFCINAYYLYKAGKKGFRSKTQNP